MLNLPKFTPTKNHLKWVDNELRTSRWVQSIWRGASAAQRRDPAFMMLLARSAWVNRGDGPGESERRARNSYLARWLGKGDGVSDDELRDAIVRKLRVSPWVARWLVTTPSGITNFYKSHRPAFARHLRRHAVEIARAFALVSKTSNDPVEKVRVVAEIVCALPSFTVPVRHSSIVNGLSPVLASLDPQRRFPIMNEKTSRLLSCLGQEQNAEGAAVLTELIDLRGKELGLRHAFDLDVYAATHSDRFPPPARAERRLQPKGRVIGFKSDEAISVVLAERRVTIRRQHNALIMRFSRAMRWRYRLIESDYDALIENWRRGRKLLIEAKTTTSGPVGRTLLRQAIGQLFDYRWRAFGGDDKVDLALLTPRKPDDDVLKLLASLGIEALWFEKSRLRGTVQL